MTARDQPERVLVALLGLLLFAYGVTALLFTDTEFRGDPIDGTANGETWLGAEGNGWTFLFFMVAGVALFGAFATRVAAKLAGLVVGLLFGAGSVIALFDGDDVLGTLAANGTTSLIWGVAALLLLAIGLAPGAPRDDDAWTPMDETRPADTVRLNRAGYPDRDGGRIRR